MFRHLRYVVLAIVPLIPAQAVAATIDLESFGDGELLTNQIPNLTFANTAVITAGLSLNELDFPPHSGSNVAYDAGGAMSIAFASPLAAFGGYFTYVVPVTIEAFSPAHVSLGQITSAFGSNVVSTGDAGSAPNEFLQLAFAGGIASVTITGDFLGNSFVLDDLLLTALDTTPPPSQPVPEPGTLALLAAGLAAVTTRSRRQR